MSGGVTAPGRGPDNDPELIRQMYADIQRLKQGEVLRAGEWSLYTDPVTGNLMKARPGQVNAVGEQAEPEVFDLTASRGFIVKDVANAVYEGVTQETIAEDEPDKTLDDVRDVLSNIPAISVPDLLGGLKGAFDAWFNRSDGTGTVAEFTYTIESIRDAVLFGYHVVTFTADTVAHELPTDIIESNGIVIGGGQNGAGANGGLHGGYIGGPIDFTGVTHIDVEIGTAGNRTTIRAAATPPHTGAILMQSPAHGSPGGIATALGYTETTSRPGNGGQAGASGTGSGEPTAGSPGSPSAIAAGGAGGARSTVGPGQDGQPGGSVSAGAQTKCGGAGGGGGGGTSALAAKGGDGGAGGYPGGAGGGRAIGWSGGANGSVGPGAPGCAWIYTKGAN